MKRILIAVLCMIVVLTTANAQKKSPKKEQTKKEDKIELKSQMDKVSYIYGLNLGQHLKQQSLNIDLNIFTKAVNDVLNGTEPLLDQKEIQDIMNKFQQEMQTKQTALSKVAGEKNKKEGESFLSANTKKEGVITLPSGLQYKVLTAGTGKMAKLTDTVTTNYRGTTIDGKEFDNSYKRGQPATFPLANVIKGWQEIIQLMPVGSKWQVFIPGELGYGENAPPGGDIGPNQTLIFEIELLSIK